MKEMRKLPKGWVWTSLKNTSQILPGNGFPKKIQGKLKGQYPFFKVGDISKNVQASYRFLHFCDNYIDDDELKAIKGKLLPKNTIVFAKIGEALKLNRRAILKTPSLIDNNAIGVKPFGRILNKIFAYFFLTTIRLENFSRATTVPSVRKTDIEEIDIPIPPIPEQDRIVAKIEELFSELDNGIENLKKARKQLKTYRQAVLKYAFEGKLTKKWRTLQGRAGNPPEPAGKLLEQINIEREKHYQKQLEGWKRACEQTKTKGNKKPVKPRKPKELPPITEKELAELSELPEGWCYCYLAHLGELARGKSKHRPRNDKKLFGGNYPFIQTGEIKAAHGIIKTYKNTYNITGLAQSKLWPKGTLCITIAANIANTAFLGFSACFPDSIVGFTAYESSIIPKFVDYFIQATREKIEAFAPATAQKNINLTTLENLLIPYCGLGEQHAIVQEIESRLSVCDKIEQTIEDSLKKAEALRQSILKKAFAGELTKDWREKHPELVTGENSAEKLLEKIKAEKALAAGRKKPRSKKTKKK
ncbi:MAG: hypothetical protein DRI57_23695 [Deltaproteobacteria bacterium]|nr:MAG: hypothetical protein DRI57_23695 [Deltaproteobacteria bacterium]